ncbi:unnamed protein product [Discula destructiva]
MRINALFLFFSLLLATTYAAAWSPSAILQSVLNKLPNTPADGIPQFILDTKHPWLATHKAWLARYPNVRDAICTRNSSLWTRPVTPAHALPEDLFAILTIDNNNNNNNNSNGVDRPCGWTNAAARLHEMHGCAAALDGARHLHIDVYVSDANYHFFSRSDPVYPPPDLSALAVDVLAKMDKLERLDWGISGEATRKFEPAFVEKNLTLPSVRHLQPGAWSDYLVSRCPNLEILEAGSYVHHWSWNERVSRLDDIMDPRLELIKATTGLPLREIRLSAGWVGWSLEMLENILDATPNITSLSMDGSLDKFHNPPYYAPETDGAVLKAYLSVLRRFPNLKQLRLPASHDLALGFDGGPWCGNAYDGPDGREYGRQVTQQAAETVELAANITLAELPALKELLVGEQCANLTFSDTDQPDMTWPWTGRMEQYTYDIWSM